MKKLLLACLCTLLACLPAMGQQKKVENLRALIAKNKEDTNKVKLLGELGELQRGNLVELKAVADEILRISQKLKYTKGILASQAHHFNYYKAKGNFDKCIEYAQLHLLLAEKTRDHVEEATAFYMFGIVYSIGLNRLDKALQYFKKALQIAQKYHIQDKVITYCNNIADVFNQTKTNLDSALYYVNRAIALANTEYQLAMFYSTKGEIYASLKDWDKAIFFLQKSIIIDEKSQGGSDTYTYNYLAHIYEEKGRLDSALYAYQRALEAYQQTQIKTYLHQTYKGLAKLYDKRGNMAEALRYHKLYMVESDSLNTARNQKSANFAEAIHEREKNKAQQEIWEKDHRIQTETNSKQRYALFALGGGFVLLTAFLAYMYRNYRQKNNTNNLLQAQNEAIKLQAQKLQKATEELTMQRDYLTQTQHNMELLSKIGTEITSSLNFVEISKRMYRMLRKLMDTDVFALWFFNEQTQSLESNNVIEHGKRQPFTSHHVSETNQASVWCFLHDKEIIMLDAEKEWTQHFQTTIPVNHLGRLARTMVYIPLHSKGKKIGVIMVQSYPKNSYNEQSIAMLRNLVVYIGIALENANTYREVTEMKEKLQKNASQLEDALQETELQKKVLELKNTELETLQQTKDLMISAVNHDLRNPLNPILNFSSPHYPNKNKDELMPMIHERAKTMLALINDIMDVYKADKLVLNPQTESLHRAGEQAIETISEAQLRMPLIVNEIPPKLEAVFEYKYIERVFENLLSNAIKYTKPAEQGGKVILFATLETEKQVRVSVQDNGMGIPQDKLEEIFLPFSNPNAKDIGGAKSVGIGLTFCKTIMEAHKSRIEVRSEVGKGSTFSFVLPAAVGKAKSSTEPTEIVLTNEERALLLPTIEELKKYAMKNARVRQILQKMDTHSLPALQAWQTAMLQAREQGNAEKFEELLFN